MDRYTIPSAWFGFMDSDNTHIDGKWFELINTNEEELTELLKDLALSLGKNEYDAKVYVYRGFKGLALPYKLDLDYLLKIARGVFIHGKPFVEYFKLHDLTEELVDTFSNIYYGDYASTADFVKEKHISWVPYVIAPHVCWQNVAIDMFCDRYEAIVDENAERVYVFNRVKK